MDMFFSFVLCTKYKKQEKKTSSVPFICANERAKIFDKKSFVGIMLKEG
jgi:hypothetical protein